jgi:hypothetical protein
MRDNKRYPIFAVCNPHDKIPLISERLQLKLTMATSALPCSQGIHQHHYQVCNRKGCDVVLDPFAGRGTKGIIVAMSHGRKFIGIYLYKENVEKAKIAEALRK